MGRYNWLLTKSNYKPHHGNNSNHNLLQQFKRVNQLLQPNSTNWDNILKSFSMIHPLNTLKQSNLVTMVYPTNLTNLNGEEQKMNFLRCHLLIEFSFNIHNIHLPNTNLHNPIPKYGSNSGRSRLYLEHKFLHGNVFTTWYH